jgi:hypothetical protein
MKQTASAIGLCDFWRGRTVPGQLAAPRLGPQLMRGR